MHAQLNCECPGQNKTHKGRASRSHQSKDGVDVRDTESDEETGTGDEEGYEKVAKLVAEGLDICKVVVVVTGEEAGAFRGGGCRRRRGATRLIFEVFFFRYAM